MAFLVCLPSLLCAGVCMGSNPDISGPIPIVDQSPVQLLFLQPIPDRADALSAGAGSFQMTTTLTNTLVDKSSQTYHARFDLETIRVCFGARYGFGNGWEVGAFIPAYYFYDGILDEFIEGVEGLFGNIRQVRKEENANSFFYKAEKEGHPFIMGYENTGGVGDAVVMIKKKVREQKGSWPTVAFRAGIKMPTGSKRKAFGSGEWDMSFGLLLEKKFTLFNAYLDTDVIFPGNGFEKDGVSLKEFYTAMVGLEHNLTPKLKVMGQLYYYTRPFNYTGVAPLGRRIYDLLLGCSYPIDKHVFIQAGLVQDVLNSADETSDIVFFLNMGRRF